MKKMSVTCLVVGCGSYFNREDVKLFSVPAVLSDEFDTDKNELSQRRRALWIAAIKRDDLTESKLKNQIVCSKHFINGKPAAFKDENHPDWVPSQEMGHRSQKLDNDRRRYLMAEHADLDGDLDSETSDHNDDLNTGVASQTDITMGDFEDSPFGLRDDPSDDTKWEFYTGFSCTFIENILYNIVADNITTTSITAHNKFNQLLLTLIKLKLNLDFQHLAYNFKISQTTALTYFERVIDILYRTLKPLIIWPDRSVGMKNIPSCFQEAFRDKTTIILDCFEVSIEKPASSKTQMQCWSNYKHRYTTKILIGFTPQGTVSYISNAWGGHASGGQIVENSGILNNIFPGDIVLADRGFSTEESFGSIQGELDLSAFMKVENQLHPVDIEVTRHIANVKLYVERIIGMVKNKFEFFKGTIPIFMLQKEIDPDNLNILEKIVTVSCVLINLSPPIVPL